jgi:hypothetical protein
VIGAFYYLRIVYFMYFGPSKSPSTAAWAGAIPDAGRGGGDHGAWVSSTSSGSSQLRLRRPKRLSAKDLGAGRIVLPETDSTNAEGFLARCGLDRADLGSGRSADAGADGGRGLGQPRGNFYGTLVLRPVEPPETVALRSFARHWPCGMLVWPDRLAARLCAEMAE